MAERPPAHPYEPERKPNGDGRHVTDLLLTTREFLNTYQPPDFLVVDVVERGRVYTLTAPTGGGKTSLALLLAILVDRGEGKLGPYEVKKGRVLYLAGENPDDTMRRLFKFAEEMEFVADDLGVTWVRGTPEGMTLTEIRDRVNKAVEQHGEFDLIIIDSSIVYSSYEKEEDRVDMLDHFRELQKFTTLPNNPAVLTTVHPVKSPNMDNLLPAGGGTFVNLVDGNLVLVKKSENLVMLTWHGKFRGHFDPVYFKLTKHRGGSDPRMYTTDEKPVWTVTIEAVSKEEAAELEEKETEKVDKLLLAMQAAPGASIRALAASVSMSASTTQRRLTDLANRKLVELNGDHYVLTPKGRKAAKTATTNQAIDQERMAF